jgi:hypothetical protein
MAKVEMQSKRIVWKERVELKRGTLQERVTKSFS